MPLRVAIVCVDTLDTFVIEGSDDFKFLFESWLRPGDHIIVGDIDSLLWFIAKDTKIKKVGRPLPKKEEYANREDCKILKMNYDLYTAMCIAWRYYEA
jgi:hypothetical protein